MEPKVYLFPLPHSMTLLRVGLPFHVYEPRYREMINDAIEMERPVAVVPARVDGNYQGQVFAGGVPEVVQTYPDGRMDIVLVGEVKGRLTASMRAGEPYEVYGYRPLSEDPSLSGQGEFLKEGLRASLANWAREHIPKQESLEMFVRIINDDEVMLGYASLFLVDDVKLRMKVLEEARWEKKVRLLWGACGPKEISLGPFLAPIRWV